MDASVSVPELLAGSPEGAWYVLDVRSPEEHAQGSVPGARLLPLADLPARWRELPAGRPIVTLCAKGGGRSEQAADYLRAQGRSPAYFLEGGYQAFLAASQEAKV